MSETTRQAPTKLKPDYDETQPTVDELKSHFSLYARAPNAHQVIQIPGMYGVFIPTEAAPSAVVSVDLCEVLRRTGWSIAIRAGQDGSIEYPYSKATGVDDEAQNTALVHDLMKTDRVHPVEGAEEISQILRDIRQQGNLVIANTSTLPGCETATINFLAKYYPGVFDGIHFNTGGHHATEVNASKAWAIRQLLGVIHPNNPSHRGLTIVSIDDRPHHNQLFHEVFGPSAATVMSMRPLCQGENLTAEEDMSTTFATPVEAFHRLRALLPQQ